MCVVGLCVHDIVYPHLDLDITRASIQVSTWNEHLESNFQQWQKLLEEQDGASNASSPTGSRRRSQR